MDRSVQRALDRVKAEGLPAFPDFHLPLPNRLGSNLSVAYDELTEKSG